jgi:phage terminase large subunit-like protein
LYEKGKVFHAKKLPELEDELCIFDGEGKSPNRMDSLVFGLSELSEGRGASTVGFAPVQGV